MMWFVCRFSTGLIHNDMQLKKKNSSAGGFLHALYLYTSEGKFPHFSRIIADVLASRARVSLPFRKWGMLDYAWGAWTWSRLLEFKMHHRRYDVGGGEVVMCCPLCSTRMMLDGNSEWVSLVGLIRKGWSFRKLFASIWEGDWIVDLSVLWCHLRNKQTLFVLFNFYKDILSTCVTWASRDRVQVTNAFALAF